MQEVRHLIEQLMFMAAEHKVTFVGFAFTAEDDDTPEPMLVFNNTKDDIYDLWHAIGDRLADAKDSGYIKNEHARLPN